jgi:hypothetical protein
VSAGELLAVNSNAGSPALTQLVQINTSTGAITPLGTLPDDTDAISFGPARTRGFIATLESLGARMLALIALTAGSLLALVGVAIWSWRNGRAGPRA